MPTLIIYCHPHNKSHNSRILQAVKKSLGKKKYEVLDLYKMRFNPAYSKNEYSHAFLRKDRIIEPSILKIQKKIEKAKNLIFIYPVWWYNMPAMLKGFTDRVFTPGFAYNFKQVSKFQECIAHIISHIPGLRYFMHPHAAKGYFKKKKAFIFRTYGGPIYGKRIFANPDTVLEHVVLRFCGITKIKIHALYNVAMPNFTQEDEEKYLEEVRQITRQI
jgi:putative NADPH-quinone reductase